MSIATLSARRRGRRINVVVETPAGSRIKYKYEPTTEVFELHKALGLGFAFPFPFGFVPGTMAEDGDPLDVMLITTLAPAAGTVAPAQVIGALAIEQSDGTTEPIRNDRLLAVPAIDHEDPPVESIHELDPSELHGIERFFIDSGAREGRHLRVLSRVGPDEALQLVTKAVAAARRPLNGSKT